MFRSVNQKLKRVVLMFVVMAILAGVTMQVNSPRTASAANTVTNCASFSGAGSLQSALAVGNAIFFDCDGTIELPGRIVINKHTGLNASGHNVTLSGGQKHGLFYLKSGISLKLIGLKLQDGNAAADKNGGAVINDGGELLLYKSTFNNNVATKVGGAVYHKAGTLEVAETTFIANKAEAGGAIYVADGKAATVTDSSFLFNKVQPGGNVTNNGDGTASSTSDNTANGGAIYNNGKLTVEGGEFKQNQATHHGGAIFNFGPATITGVDFISNKTTVNGGEGGAIYNYVAGLTVHKATLASNTATTGGAITNRDGNLTLTYNTLKDNQAKEGAGLWNNSADLLVKASLFHNNMATDGNGGGIFNKGKGVTIANTTFVNNKASANGGGLATDTALVNLLNSTLAHNSAAYAGGIYAKNGTITLGNTILFNNVHAIGNNNFYENCGGQVLNAGGNFQFPGNSCGAAAQVADPKLGPLQNNFGPTLTMELLPGSPAIDSGMQGLCNQASIANKDQRGFSRNQDGNLDGWNQCDSGAFEVITKYYIGPVK